MASNILSKIRLFFAVILASFLFSLPCFADGSTISLKADKTDLSPGDEITLTADLSDDTKIYALTATLQYDQNVFEPITDNNFTVSSTETVQYNSENNQFGIINQSGAVSDDFLTVRLRVKEDTNVGDTNIALTNITTSDGQTKTSYSTASTKVLVAKDATEGETIPTSQENAIIEQQTPAQSVLSATPFVIIALIVVGIIVLVAILHFGNLTPNTSKLYYSLICLGAVIAVLIGAITIINNSKKDVNGDGNVDYGDATKVVDYLINLEGSSDQNQDNDSSNSKNNGQTSASYQKMPYIPSQNAGRYDINNDGQVDISDVAHVTENVTKETKASLKNSDDQSAYVQKGHNTLVFAADVQPEGVTISGVKIGDKYYNVDNNNGTYTVEIDPQYEAGKKSFTISELLMSNDKKLPANLTINFEVLKSLPELINFLPDVEHRTIQFDIYDPDGAFTSGQAKIYDGESSEQEIASAAVTPSVTVTISDEDLKEDKTYRLEVSGAYCLTEDQNTSYCYDNNIFFTHHFMFSSNYNFELTNYSLTDYINPGSVPIINFISTNSKDLPIFETALKIDNQDHTYQPTNTSKDNYEIVLDQADLTPGRHTVSIESVTLDSLQTFTNPTEFTADSLTYFVPHNAPLVNNLVLQDEKDKKSIKVDYHLEDPDLTATRLTFLMSDSTGKIVARKELAGEELFSHRDQSFELSYGDARDKHFTVKVLADYDLGDKYNFKEQQLAEGAISALSENDLYLNDVYTRDMRDMDKPSITRYAEKGQNRFQLVMNVNAKDGFLKSSQSCAGTYGANNAASVTVNGNNYPTGSAPKDRTAVMLGMPSEAGVISLKVNRLQYIANGYYCKPADWFSVPVVEYKVEVLKDAPKIENLTTTENHDQNSVTFDFDLILDSTAQENDQSFIDGKIELGDSVQTYNTRGHNTITFENITPNETMKLNIKASYDRDTDALNDLDSGQDKNQFTDQTIYSAEYGLYDPELYSHVQIEGEALSNTKEDNDEYFEKNETIGLYLKITGLPADLKAKPIRATVKERNETYELMEIVDENGEILPNEYAIMVPGYSESGRRSLTISEITLDNGKKITPEESDHITFEILKDIATITDFDYKEDAGEIKITAKLNDPDESLVGDLNILVENELGEQVYTGPFTGEVSFEHDIDSHLYVTITGSYSRSNPESDLKHRYLSDDVTLLKSTISLENNFIELKNIVDINLYHVVNNYPNLTDQVSVEEINSDQNNYFAEIAMNEMPTVRIKVASAKKLDGHLYLILDSDNIILDNKIKYQKLELDFGELDENGKANNEFHQDVAFKKLIEKLVSGDDVELTRDYDASSISTPLADYYVDEYAGKLEGNGHTISNLSRPLFNKVKEGAEIEDLILDNVSVNSSSKGALANSITKAEIKEVVVHGFTISGAAGGVGGLAGSIDNSEIKSCAVTELSIGSAWAKQQMGGIAGTLSNNSKITDSYAIGRISGGWNYMGGIVGDTSGESIIENSYSKVDLGNADISCGITCSYRGNANVKNSVSLSYNYKTSPIAEKYGSDSSNNYYVNTVDKEFSDQGDKQIKIVDTSTIDSHFFSEKPKFNTSTWRLDSTTSYDNPPELKFESAKTSSDYNPAKITLYNNLFKLTPYYETDKVIKDAKYIKDTDLNSKQIKTIIPRDANGNIVTFVTNQDLDKITNLRVTFSDGTVKDYAAIYDKTYDMVASYRIRDLHYDYTFPHYVINIDERTIDNLTYYLKSLDYTNNLDSLSAKDDSRLYREFYDNTTKNELKEFILKYLSSSNYTNTNSDENINNYIERKIKQNGDIKKALYVYNYLRRFYNLEVDGAKLYDFVMFASQGTSGGLTPDEIATKFLSNNDYIDTNKTSDTFVNIFRDATGLSSMPEFLEFAVKSLGHGQSMDDWVHSQFKGYLAERSADGSPDYDSPTGLTEHNDIPDLGLHYTLWDHFSNKDAKQGFHTRNYILPILTLPENSTYIISTPVQFVIGSQRTYIQDPNAPGAREAFNIRVNAYANRMKTYFTTAYGIIQDKDLFNGLHLYQLDKIIVYNNDGTTTKARPGSTEDPHHKNFNEVIGRFSADGGINAGAYADRVEWDVAGVMDANIKEVADALDLSWGEATFGTYSHESAHMLDSRLWMRDQGRRWDAGGEDYADGNLRQEFNGNLIVMNVSKDWGEDCDYGSNCSPERINTTEKLRTFYQKVFDVIYTIDYIEAQAFLQLNSEQKAGMALQVSYPNATGETFSGKLKENFPTGLTTNEKSIYRAYQTSKYTRLEAKDFDAMELDDIDDLYDNKLMIYPGVYQSTSRGSNSYGGEGLNVAHWYQPYNDYGRPDSYSLKWLAYEMMGLKGYDEGYVEYYSNIHPSKDPYTYYSNFETLETATASNYKTDLMALKKITGKDDITFESYKKGRFAEIEQKLSHLNTVINVKDYVKRFYDAMIEDVKYQAEATEKKFKDWGGKEKCLNDDWCFRDWAPYGWVGLNTIHSLPNSTKVRQEIYQTLKKLTNDFLDEGVIYNDKYNQDVSNLSHLIDKSAPTPAEESSTNTEPAQSTD